MVYLKGTMAPFFINVTYYLLLATSSKTTTEWSSLTHREVKGSCWKKIQGSGLQQRYQDDDDFSLHARMIMALAFVPPADLDTACDDLFTEIRNNFNNDFDDILNYFEDTYIGRLRRNGRRDAPLFSGEMWNMYNRTRNHLP